MPFPRGPISYTRYVVIGEQPKAIDTVMLAGVSTHAFTTPEFGAEEINYGWCGDYLYDTTFSFEKNVFADCLHLNIRVDTNRMPGPVKAAKLAQIEAEMAAGNPSGFISKLQRRMAKDELKKWTEAELRSGRHLRHRLIPVLYDVANGIVYSPACGQNVARLMELFERTFGDLAGTQLCPMTAGWTAEAAIGAKVLDLKPAHFADSPSGRKDPECPFVQCHCWLGCEWLLWLWWMQQPDGGMHGPSHGSGANAVAIVFDRTLQLDCAYGETGRDIIRGDATVSSPEARKALRVGKLPRKTGLILEYAGHQYELTLTPETMAVQSLRLPEVEDAESPRVIFEERIAMLRDLGHALDGLYRAFLAIRLSDGWLEVAESIRQWIAKE